MNVLVTGGAGFVGRHVVKQICDIGYDVTVVDNLVSESASPPDLWMNHLKPNRKFKFLNEDARAFFARSSEKFDIIIHLAAIVGGRLQIEFAPLSVAEDLALDAEMYNWAVKAKPRKIVFFSSSAAYPIKHQTRENNILLSENLIDLDGDTIGKPDLTYGWAKLTGEYLSRLAHQRHGMNCVCFRPFSGYGEDQHTNYPFPSILRRVMNYDGHTPIDVWGSGEQVRDFIYIDDCVDGMLDLMDKISDGSAVNLGTGIPTSFENLIYDMSDVIHKTRDVNLNKLLDKPEGVFYRACDSTKMKDLGFFPKYSLKDGIQRCYDILKERKYEK